MEDDKQVQPTAETDGDEFTEDELAYMRSAACPPTLKRIMRDKHRVAALKLKQQAVAVMRTEVDYMLLERTLIDLEGGNATVEAARAEAEAERRKREAIETQLAIVQEQNTELIAQQALVVHSGTD